MGIDFNGRRKILAQKGITISHDELYQNRPTKDIKNNL